MFDRCIRFPFSFSLQLPHVYQKSLKRINYVIIMKSNFVFQHFNFQVSRNFLSDGTRFQRAKSGGKDCLQQSYNITLEDLMVSYIVSFLIVIF